MIAVWLRRYRPNELPAGLVKYLPDKPAIAFHAHAQDTPSRFRRSPSLAAVGSFMAVDMNYGIDFRGGSSIEVKASRAMPTSARCVPRLSELNLGDVQVQEFGSPRTSDPHRRRRKAATTPSSRRSTR